jgi:hypothetical protein
MHELIEAILSRLRRSAPREARRVGVGQVLDYSPVWKAMAKLAWLFPIVITAVSLYSPPSPAESWIPAAIVAGFCALLIPLSLEVVQRQIELTDQGIAQRSAWSKPVKMGWKDVRDIAWKKVSNEVVIQPKSGRTIRVNVWLSGMETFAHVLEKRLAHLPSMPGVVNAIRAHLAG